MELFAHMKEVFDRFKSVFLEGDLTTAETLMSQLKVLLQSFPPPLPPPTNGGGVREQALARDIYEYAIMMIEDIEDPEFDKVYDQLRPFYYSDDFDHLPPSYYKYSIIGRYLVRLLEDEEIEEFHNEVESLPDVALTALPIKGAIEMEKLLSEQDGLQFKWKIHNGSLCQISI